MIIIWGRRPSTQAATGKPSCKGEKSPLQVVHQPGPQLKSVHRYGCTSVYLFTPTKEGIWKAQANLRRPLLASKRLYPVCFWEASVSPLRLKLASGRLNIQFFCTQVTHDSLYSPEGLRKPCDPFKAFGMPQIASCWVKPVSGKTQNACSKLPTEQGPHCSCHYL